ncbi:MAG: hypothetical protein PHU81_09160 [Acidobacteriota bacterium]|nr:hypothetical protein [Acidobacteriota bacterium]
MKKKQEETLKSIFLSSKDFEKNVSRRDCPEPEDLARSFDPGAGLEFKETIVDHLSRCLACQQEFEFLHLSEKLVTEISRKLLKPKRPIKLKLQSFFSSSSLIKKAAVTFTALIIVFSLVYYLNSNYRKAQEVERNPREVQNLMMTEEIAKPASLAIALKWQPVEQALFYQVEVFNQNMYLIWQSPPARDTLIRLPEEVTNVLKNDRCFFWQILIYTPGEKFVDSPVRKVKLNLQ